MKSFKKTSKVIFLLILFSILMAEGVQKNESSQALQASLKRPDGSLCPRAATSLFDHFKKVKLFN
jgi:hypothetical protein